MPECVHPPVPYRLGRQQRLAEGLARDHTVTLVAADPDGWPSPPRGGTEQGEIPAGWQQRRHGVEGGASGSLGAGALGRVLSPVWGGCVYLCHKHNMYTMVYNKLTGQRQLCEPTYDKCVERRPSSTGSTFSTVAEHPNRTNCNAFDTRSDIALLKVNRRASVYF